MERTNSEKLAFERTVLANERTYLAYIRSFIVTLSSGLAILKLEFLSNLKLLGIVLTVVGPILFIAGTIRFFYVKYKLRKIIPSRGLKREGEKPLEL